MGNQFDHLLGLNVRSALAILQSYGIRGVHVTLTGAPSMAAKRAPECVPVENGRISALAAIGKQFSVGEDEDDPSFDPILDDALEEGMLVESRVVAVRDDGRQLIAARFHTGEPKPCPIEPPQV